MKTDSRNALAHPRRVSVGALRRAALWGAGTFVASALLVSLIAWVASGSGATLSTSALLVGLALGLATGWAAGLIALTHETLRVIAASLGASAAKRPR